MMNLDSKDEQQEEISEINVTPFIDVMLVLLIIFMVTIPLATVNIPLNLPAISEEKQENTGTPVILSLDAQKQLFLGNDQISFEDLVEKIDIATQKNKDIVIFFRIDNSVQYEEMMRIMNLLRGAGYLKIGLVGLDQATDYAK
ncbi:biopolymer transporter ExbD [Seminibacterium arietis]|uniref:Biopolymer transporter ExbD n=1 Tax=Seminibacterium arietis TaxID=1173502 RepID=A0ABW3IAS0_9PAST